MIDATKSSNDECVLPEEAQTCSTAIPLSSPCDSLNTENRTPKTSVEDAPDMIPVRMLNEFTYCPRLGYLEWVEGEWSSNLETMEGTFGHRRVDQATKRAKRKAESGEQKTQETNNDGQSSKNESDSSENRKLQTENSIHSRSLMLSAPSEGLLAKLDLLEMDGMEVTPVDYKRGKAPAIPEGAYEPERVQLCAQGLILRANGFRCDRGVLYFIASKTRVNDNGFKSIAFPLIGAGSGSFNQGQAKSLMLDELSKLDVPMLVKIVVFTKAKT